MKKLFQAAFAAMFMFAAASASAYTDCTGTIGWIGHDTSNNHSYVQLSTGGAGFDLLGTDANHNEVMAQVFFARVSGTQVIMRFSAGGVNCATNAYRTDLLQFWVNP